MLFQWRPRTSFLQSLSHIAENLQASYQHLCGSASFACFCQLVARATAELADAAQFFGREFRAGFSAQAGELLQGEILHVATITCLHVGVV
jgi:hypothetical protein